MNRHHAHWLGDTCNGCQASNRHEALAVLAYAAVYGLLALALLFAALFAFGWPV